MREILFRGKRVDNGEWIEGYLTGRGASRFIVNELIQNAQYLNSYRVNSTSVGQFIGLHDKNGEKIFEGDIVLSISGVKGVVGFFENLVWEGLGSDHSGFYCYEWMIHGELDYHCGFHDCEIIGNIHDNPELIGK